MQGRQSVAAVLRSSSFWAVVRGASLSASSFGLPFLVARFLTQNQFNAWVLIFGLVAWFPFVDAGMSSAVIRIAARFQSVPERLSVATIATSITLLPVLLIVIGTLVIGFFVDDLFPDLAKVADLQSSLSLVGVVSASSILALPVAAFLLSVQRTKFLALNTLFFKTFQLAAVFGMAIATRRLVAVVITWCAIEVIQNAILWRKCLSFGRTPIDRRVVGRDLMRHVKGYLPWAISGLFVARLDVIVVGRVDAPNVGVYGLALAVASIVSGLHNAVIVPVIPTLSNCVAESTDPTPWFFRFTSKANMFLGVSALGSITIVSHLSKWMVRPSVRPQFVQLMVLLVVANWIRLTCATYASALVAHGLHAKVKLSPAIEAATNFVASIVLGNAYGSTGVAIGTVLGAIVSVGLHLSYNMKRYPIQGLAAGQFFRRAIAPSSAILAVGLLIRSVTSSA